jgi:hypothetical protein
MRKLALLASVIILTPLGLAAAVKSLTPDMPASPLRPHNAAMLPAAEASARGSP